MINKFVRDKNCHISIDNERKFNIQTELDLVKSTRIVRFNIEFISGSRCLFN